MVHKGLTTVLLYLAIFMATLLVTPGAAMEADTVKNKDEALAYCNSIQGSKDDYVAVYPGTQGDVFYRCGDKTEKQSNFKAGTPCNYPKEQRDLAPARMVFYKCEHNHLQIIACHDILPLCRTVTDYR